MKRSLSKSRLNANEAVFKATMESPPCTGADKEFWRLEMLKSITENPALLNVRNKRFETLKMSFVGEKWVIEMEAQEPVDDVR